MLRDPNICRFPDLSGRELNPNLKVDPVVSLWKARLPHTNFITHFLDFWSPKTPFYFFCHLSSTSRMTFVSGVGIQKRTQFFGDTRTYANLFTQIFLIFVPSIFSSNYYFFESFQKVTLDEIPWNELLYTCDIYTPANAHKQKTKKAPIVLGTFWKIIKQKNCFKCFILHQFFIYIFCILNSENFHTYVFGGRGIMLLGFGSTTGFLKRTKIWWEQKGGQHIWV